MSLFVLGLSINSCWMQSVLMDKRPEKTEDPAGGERGPRISQTFRHIGLFLTPSSFSHFPSSSAGQYQEKQEQQLIFVKGATGMTRAERSSWHVVARRRSVYSLHSAR
jgi:hypothetical protein